MGAAKTVVVQKSAMQKFLHSLVLTVAGIDSIASGETLHTVLSNAIAACPRRYASLQDKVCFESVSHSFMIP